MHFKLDLHAIQLGEVTRWGVRAYSSGILVSGCPGPGSSWGDLTVPPPSKEGKSPTKLVLLVLLVQVTPPPNQQRQKQRRQANIAELVANL